MNLKQKERVDDNSFRAYYIKIVEFPCLSNVYPIFDYLNKNKGIPQGERDCLD